MAMTAQEYLDTFNAAINSGAYDSAANILRAAEGDFGPGIYDVAGVVLEANPNLPQEIDYMSPQGIQSIRDYVASVPAPVTAVSPRLNLVNTLPETGLVPSGNVSGTGAGVVSSGPPVGSLQNPAVQSPIKLATTMTRPEPPAPAVDPVAQDLLRRFDSYMDAASSAYGTGAADFMFSGAANVLNEAAGKYGNDVYGIVANYLNTDPRFAGLREQVGGAAYTPSNLKSFVESQLAAQQTPTAAPPTAAQPTTPAEGIATLPTVQTTPGPGQIYGMPRFERQEFTPLTFAPLRRGSTQLRPAMFMPGLTSGQAPLGGSGFRPEDLRTANQGLSPAERAYYMDVGGVSPAELAAATGTPVGQIQGEYNLTQPGGMFSTAPSAPIVPQNFALQTGAYGAPTPTFITSGSTAAGNTTAEPKDKFAQIIDNVQRLAQDVSSLQNPAQYEGAKAGGIIKMAEGGEAMPKLSASEAGSKFDISEFIDEQGRLVGGYSKPIYDENQVVVGYDYRPYERDVVFNPRLAEAEARGMSDEEREAARRGMVVRQGLTGVDPYAGGLPGIRAREALMRSRPQYYSYAEGGLANVAQNLAERGRKGDSMLVHMAPEEVAGLRALARAQGTDLTINPRTGLPEAFSLKKLFKAASFVLPFVPIPGLFGMSSLLTKSILSGVAAGASAKGGFDFKQALGGGLRAYALGSLGEKLGGAPDTTAAQASQATASVPDAAAVNPMGDVTGVPGEIPSPSELGQYQGVGGAQGAPVNMYGSYSDTAGGIQTAPRVSIGPDIEAAAPIDTYTLRGGPQTGEAFYNTFPSDAVTTTPGSLPPGADTVPGRMSSVITPEGQGFGKPLTKGTEIAMAGLGGFSIEEGAKEARRYEIEAAAARREDEERQRRFEELARRTLGNVRTAKAGGSINLAKGGMTYMEAGGTTDVTGEPRMVQGTGDGMSDSVPATIEGIQEARLANDEFVIPADVVADIGNGSSNAGAKKLYDMMDRIRKARHGTTKQPPEIKAERLMPA